MEVCSCTFMGVGVTPVCVGVCIRSVHLEVRGQPWMLFFPSGSFCFWFETGFLIDIGLCHIGQAIRLLHFQKSFCLCLPSLSLTLFYVGSGDLNLRPHTCKANTLPTELSLHPSICSFCSKICTLTDVKLSASLITSCRVNIYEHSCRTVNMSGSAVLAQVLHGRTHGMLLNMSGSRPERKSLSLK